MVVQGQCRRRQAADGHRGRHARAADAAAEHPVAAVDGDQAEEHEHRQLAERRVGDRPRAAHVGQRGRERGCADGQHRPAALRGQRQAERRRQQRRHDDRHAHLAHAEPAFGRGPWQAAARAAALAAAQRVADVVLQVGDELHQQRRAQHQQHGQRVDTAVARVARRCADQHRAQGDEQAARARGRGPGRPRRRSAAAPCCVQGVAAASAKACCSRTAHGPKA